MTTLIYDWMTGSRLMGEWIAASLRIGGRAPGFSALPFMRYSGAAGEVFERAFSSIGKRPAWGLDPVDHEGRACAVVPTVIDSQHFGNLVKFMVEDRPPQSRRVLLVAPMSGHYATLLREQVASLLPHADVWVTDWHNARDIPVSAGRFGLDEYVTRLEEWLEVIDDSSLHVVAVCQPVPLVVAAASRLKSKGKALFASVTLMGGPVDPEASPTQVTDFGSRVSMKHLEGLLHHVGHGFPGMGRLVYPGVTQLSSFISMNPDNHVKAFAKRIAAVAWDDNPDDGHDRFYDEYLAVMDLPAEFYMETVEVIFRNRALALGELSIKGELVDPSVLKDVPLAVIEGERDDICAPGQCSAIFSLVPQEAERLTIVTPDSGHYGIFAGRGWRTVGLPSLLKFWDGLGA